MSNKRDWSRYQKAYELRKEGKTYKIIGEILGGVCLTRASQMVKIYERRLKREEFIRDNPHLQIWEKLPKAGQNELIGEYGIDGQSFNKFLEIFEEADSFVRGINIKTQNQLRKLREKSIAKTPKEYLNALSPHEQLIAYLYEQEMTRGKA